MIYTEPTPAIHIGTHRITFDEYNVILWKHCPSTEKLGKDKVPTGEFTKEGWDVQGYYRTIPQAVSAMVDAEIRRCTPDVKMLLIKVDELTSLVRGFYEEYDDSTAAM